MLSSALTGTEKETEQNTTQHNTGSLINVMTDGRSYNLQYYNPVKYIDYNAVRLQ